MSAMRRGGLTYSCLYRPCPQRSSAACVCVVCVTVSGSSVLGHFFHSWPENVASMRLAL